jgi:Ca2+-binding RTX toxin-like protein
MALIRGTARRDVLRGTSAGDTILGLGGNDTLSGGNGADTIKGGDGIDVIKGENGDDRLYGDAGNDDIRGGAGNDRIFGGADVDKLRGEAGNDVIFGGAGNETVLFGGDGNDAIWGDAGNDTLNGDAGNDTLYAGPGADTINGGSDTGTFSFTTSLYVGGDTLSYADATSAIGIDLDAPGASTGGAAGDIFAGIEHLVGSRFNDGMIAGSAGGYVFGGGGDDFIVADPAGFSILRGDAGTDFFSLGAGADSVWLQYDQGTDRIEFFNPGADFLYVSASEFGLASAPANFLSPAELSIQVDPYATLAADRFIFETDTRTLWADKDGSGGTFLPKPIAVIDDVLGLGVGNIWVIA